MSLLNKYSLPAERELGCVFSDIFESATTVQENGATIGGSPTYDEGIVLNGTTDYLVYNSISPLLYSTSISFEIEFVPYFNYDSDNFYYLFDSTSTARSYILKRNNAGNNELLVGISNASVGVIAASTYGPYWITNGVNKLVLTSTTGNTSVWLNGNIILDSSSTAWTKSNATEFFLGSRNSGSTYRFYGKFKKFKIFQTLLDDNLGEILSDVDSTNEIYDYRNVPLISLPMTAEYDDTTSISDVSGNNYTATKGDGSTPTTYPEKLSYMRGYSFTGTSSQYLNFGDNDNFTFYENGALVPFTISSWIECNPNSTNYISILSKYLSASISEFYFGTLADGKIYFIVYDNVSGSNKRIGIYYNAVLATLFPRQPINVVAVFDGTASAINLKIYINGNLMPNSYSQSTPFNQVSNTNNNLEVGKFGTNYSTMKMHRLDVFRNKALNKLQILDLYLRDKRMLVKN